MMSDQTNPQAENVQKSQTDIVNAAEPVEEGASATAPKVEETVASAKPAPAHLPSPPTSFEIGGDDDGDDVDDEEDEEEFSAPAQYVEREGSGRPRRIGSDIRIDDIDYKNIALLSRFLDRRGRILSRRKTRVSAKVQRKIVREIKRSRHLALLPYTADQTRIVRKRK